MTAQQESKRYKLWEYLKTDFGVLLLESDIDEIISLVRNIIKEEDEAHNQ